jgi:predicted dinucleotide-binding enzyme
MKLLVAFGVGFLAGMAVARRLTRDDPNVVIGPSSASRSRLASATDGLLGQATGRSLGAIRKARGSIQERLAAYSR